MMYGIPAERKRCVECGKHPGYDEMMRWSAAGRKEWGISGLCEPCFDKITRPPDDENGVYRVEGSWDTDAPF